MQAAHPTQDGTERYVDKLARIHARRSLVEQVIAGAVSLEEATRRFRMLGGVSDRLANDDVSVCRLLIGWANLELSDRPERATQVAEKLELQLNEVFHAGGKPPGAEPNHAIEPAKG